VQQVEENAREKAKKKKETPSKGVMWGTTRMPISYGLGI
jgi:hypothetical protein